MTHPIPTFGTGSRDIQVAAYNNGFENGRITRERIPTGADERYPFDHNHFQLSDEWRQALRMQLGGSNVIPHVEEYQQYYNRGFEHGFATPEAAK